MTNGPVDLVFLPGVLSDDQVWRHQLTELKDNYKIQVIPLTDFECPKKMVEHVLNRAPNEFILIGHSLGGWISLEVAKSAPQRVKGLGLLNTTARPESMENKIWRERLIQKVNNLGFENVITNLLPIYLTPMDWGNPVLHSELLSMFLRVGKDAFIRQQMAIINRPGSIDYLNQIHCPTLIIHSSSDVIMSYEMQEEMLSRIPNAKIELVRECGHFSMLEKPSDVTRILKHWLNENAS